MLRIHFTGEDLIRTRVAAAPDPLWELALSMHVLRVKGGDPMMAGWKRDVAQALRPGDPLRDEVALLLALNPPLGYFPDFLTPAAASGGFEAGLDAILSTSKSRLKREITTLGESKEGLPSLVSDLSEGKAEALDRLATAITGYHRVAIVPVWDRVRAAFDADRAVRGRAVLDGGMAALLDSLHPTVRFADNVLEISEYPTQRTLHLRGRGLLLVPSFFKSWSRPMALLDPELPRCWSTRSATARTATARRPGRAATGLS